MWDLAKAEARREQLRFAPALVLHQHSTVPEWIFSKPNRGRELCVSCRATRAMACEELSLKENFIHEMKEKARVSACMALARPIHELALFYCVGPAAETLFHSLRALGPSALRERERETNTCRWRFWPGRPRATCKSLLNYDSMLAVEIERV